MRTLMEELLVYGELLTDVDYDIVTIHPLADEPELLNELNLSPEQITLCDLYWGYNNRLFFVSIGYRAFTSATFVTYRRKLGIEHGHRFWVNTNVSPLTKAVVNKCLHYLAAWIDSNDSVLAETDKAAHHYQSLPEDDLSTPSSTDAIIISTSDIVAAN